MRFGFLLVTIGIFFGLIDIVRGEPPRKIKGNCEELFCDLLWQQLQTNFPKKQLNITLNALKRKF